MTHAVVYPQLKQILLIAFSHSKFIFEFNNNGIDAGNYLSLLLLLLLQFILCVVLSAQDAKWFAKYKTAGLLWNMETKYDWIRKYLWIYKIMINEIQAQVI